MKKKTIFIGIAVILVVVGVVIYLNIRSSIQKAQSAYETEAARYDQMTSYVGATGNVQSNQSATLVWQTSGRVDTVTVEKDKPVQADGVLSSLVSSSLSQSVILAQADLIKAKDNLDSILDNDEARLNAYIAMLDAKKEMDDAEDDTTNAKYRRASQENIDIARANLTNANEALEDAQDGFDFVENRGEDDVIYANALIALSNAKKAQQKAQYNWNYVQGLPDPDDVLEVNAKYDLAKAKYQAAVDEWERLRNGADPDDIATAQASIDAAQATVDMARLTAPFAGTITGVDIKPGDLVTAGTVAFQIEDLSRLLVDVQVSEVDINRVQIGQTVDLTFDAIQDKQYTGMVSEIASTGVSTGGAVNFTVSVEITDADASVKPGMTAAANIAVSQLSNVLVVPSRAVRTVNGERVVYVLKNGQIQMVKISLGTSSNKYTQITEGDLSAGDLVVTNPPTTMNMMGGAQ